MEVQDFLTPPQLAHCMFVKVFIFFKVWTQVLIHDSFLEQFQFGTYSSLVIALLVGHHNYTCILNYSIRLVILRQVQAFVDPLQFGAYGFQIWVSIYSMVLRVLEQCIQWVTLSLSQRVSYYKVASKRLLKDSLNYLGWKHLHGSYSWLRLVAHVVSAMERMQVNVTFHLK